jgi:hypothetical protein
MTPPNSAPYDQNYNQPTASNTAYPPQTSQNYYETRSNDLGSNPQYDTNQDGTNLPWPASDPQLGPNGTALRTNSTGPQVHPDDQHSRSLEMKGKLQSAAGTLLMSNALKAKGEQKQREAYALNMQSAELAEAERLEEEARTRRERAVQHGAHPNHGHLGGIVPGSNNNDIGGVDSTAAY